LALALAHRLIDQAGWPALGRSFGVNAIAAYAGAWTCTVVLEGFGLMAPLYAGAFGWIDRLAGPFNASLAFALAFVAVWSLIVMLMDRRGIYIKVWGLMHGCRRKPGRCLVLLGSLSGPAVRAPHLAPT